MIMTVPLDNGKYEITMADNKITATRHGEPWRDLTGDNLMYFLLLRNADLECKIYELQQTKTNHKVIVIENCAQCPYHSRTGVYGLIAHRPRCDKKGCKILPYIEVTGNGGTVAKSTDVIPTWCPLEDC